MKKIVFFLCNIFICLNSFSQQIFGFSYYTNEEDSVVVTQVYKNSPADKAGLKVGDFLNFINDIPFSFKKKEVLAKVLSETSNTNNKLRFYRTPNVLEVIINKAPLSSFEYTCISGDCQNSDCVIESTFGFVIKGKCLKGKISGEASMYDENEKLIFKGNVIHNLKQGFGIDYYIKSNTRYEGQFANGIREGAGKYYLADHSYLQGNWINNKLEGEVSIFNANKEFKEKQTFKDGKKIIDINPIFTSEKEQSKNETKSTQNLSNIASSNSNGLYTKASKNPAFVKNILDNKTGTWDLDFFSDKYPNTIPKKQKPPFEKIDYKTLASAAEVTPEALKNIIEQCAYENWPSFYKTYKDINAIFKYAFRNLKVQNVLTFRSDKNDGEYKRYGQYTIIFINDKENKHAPKELLSDDGIGFFMCVDAELIQDFINPSYNYSAFSLESPLKGGGFGNWASKKEVFLLDMVSIEDDYYNSGWNYTDIDVQTKLGLSDVEFNKLKNLCNVQFRPDGLKTPQQIKDAQRNAVFTDMKAYTLANLGASFLIYVPKNENQYLSQNMQPKNNEGWFFCTKSYVNTVKPSESYISQLKATSDAAMQQYKMEQAARDEKMKQDAQAQAEWLSKNKFKGVVIIQYKNDNAQNVYERYKYNIISIFASSTRTVEQSDYNDLLDTYSNYYQASGYKYVVINFEKGLNESQAIEKATELTQTHKYNVNTNFSYTLPEYKNQVSNNNNSALKKSDEELKKNQKERDNISMDIEEDKTMEKVAMRQKAMSAIFSDKKTIKNSTQVIIIDVLTSDKYYLENKKFIGKSGIVEASLTENGDGSYYGTILFPNEKYSTIFYNVKVNVIP